MQLECNADGVPIISHEELQTTGVPPMRIFELGMEFRLISEKKLEAWLIENADEINALPKDVQGLIVARWQKDFGVKPMPQECTFFVGGDFETGEPVSMEDNEPGVDMEG